MIIRRGSVELKFESEVVEYEGLERKLIEQALKNSMGSQTNAARALGITRDQLRYRMAKMAKLNERVRKAS